MPCGGSEEQPNKAMNVLCRPRVQSQVRHVLCVARIDAYFGAHGDSGDKSSKEQLFRNKRCQKGAEIVRRKFH